MGPLVPVPTSASSTLPQWATVAVYSAIILAASLAALFSLIAVGGRVVRPRNVRMRLRAGMVAAIVVLLLAALDIYLALTAL